eukprot:3938805-Rhodomonas_salina.1
MVVLTDEGEVVVYSTALRAVLVSDVNGAPFTDMAGEVFDVDTNWDPDAPALTAMAATASGLCLVTGSVEGKVMLDVG